MTKLYLNAAQDWLMVNAASDWLMLGGSTVADYPSTPAPYSATVTSYSPTYVSVTHGLQRLARSRGAHAWQLELLYSGMTRATFSPLLSFLIKQAGQFGRFTVAVDALANRGAGGGSPKVNGAGQTGTSLITDGWPNSTAILKSGDWIQVENDPKVYQVIEDVSSNGSGQATLTIFPALRVSPNDNLAISTDVVFYCALASDSVAADWTQCLHSVGFTVELVEVQ